MCSELCAVTSTPFASAGVVTVISTTTLPIVLVVLGEHRLHWEMLDLFIKPGNRGLRVFGLDWV